MVEKPFIISNRSRHDEKHKKFGVPATSALAQESVRQPEKIKRPSTLLFYHFPNIYAMQYNPIEICCTNLICTRRMNPSSNVHQPNLI
jgi:hypothetical protein